MRRLILFALLAGMAQVAFAQRPYQGIGIRLGEPTGITYKNYFTKTRAFELGLGTASSGWNSNYYQKSFHDRSGYNGYNYTSHNVDNIVYFQARYLLNYDLPIEGVEGKFDWYWGVGAVLKLARVNYYYQNELPPYPAYTDRRTDIDFGPEGVGGVEYHFEDLPITLFVDVSLMIEVADHLGVRAFGGTGARYTF
jgi:hypothetical protein